MSKGFSLIELLIVVAIVSIITAIAYPGYRNHIIRAHRSEGQIALLDLANRMERYYSEHDTYQTAQYNVLKNPTTDGSWYRLSITQATNTSYVLQATPIGTQATNDTLCQSLTLTSSGVKDITSANTAPTGNNRLCW